MKAVSGALCNAADAHPDWQLDRRFLYSAAKRAAGTLTAEWPEVLAARLARRQERASRILGREPRRGVVSGLQRHSPFKLLWERLSIEVGKAKNANDKTRADAIIEVLRMIAELQRERD